MSKTENKAVNSSATTAYLIAFNVLSGSAWAWILFTHFSNLSKSSSFSLNLDFVNLSKNTWFISKINTSTFKDLYFPLALVQSLAILEVFHALVKLVKSPLGTVCMQVASRLFVVWAICFNFANSFELQSTPLFTSMVVAWSVTEIIRSAFYFCVLLFGSDHVPYFIVWLRYTLFFVLYPVGASSEAYLVYLVLPLADPMLKYCFLIILCMYPIGFTTLYGYMIKQRQKVLYPKDSKKKKA